MSPTDLVVAVLGGGGILGGIVALFKLRPEVARVTVSAAEGAVIVQTGVIENLSGEITRLRTEIIEERRNCDQEIARCQAEIKSVHEILSRIDERQSNRLLPEKREDGP